MATAAIGIPTEGGGPERLLIVIVLKDQTDTKINFEEMKDYILK